MVRAEAFKALKPATEIFSVADEAAADVQAVMDQYDDFVFFNGHICAESLATLTAAGKRVYTFDMYASFLDELQKGSTLLKGVMAQNTFGMTRKAVEAVIAGASQGEMVPAFFITWDNLGDDAVKPFLDFYGKEAYPPIDGLEEKLVGKWMLDDINGKPAPTNNKFVVTFTSAGRGYMSASLSGYTDTELKPLWSDRQEFNYAIADNVVTMTSKIDDHLTVVDELTVASISDAVTNGILKIKWIIDGTMVKSVEETVRTLKVTDDYSQTALGLWEGRVTSEQSEYDDGEEHRWCPGPVGGPCHQRTVGVRRRRGAPLGIKGRRHLYLLQPHRRRAVGGQRQLVSSLLHRRPPALHALEKLRRRNRIPRVVGDREHPRRRDEVEGPAPARGRLDLHRHVPDDESGITVNN